MKISAVLLALIASFTVSAQVDIINRSLTDSSKNFFYIGVDNTIQLKFNRKPVNPNTVSMRIQGGAGTMMATGNYGYIVRVNNATKDCHLLVLVNGKEVLNKTYTVALIPPAISVMGGLHNTTASKTKLLLNPYLNIVMPDCWYNHRDHIFSFSATFIHDGDSTATHTNNNVLSNEQKQWISKLIPGDTIWFDDIRVTCPDCRISTGPPFWIKIE